MKKILKLIVKKTLALFTLAKICGAIITVTIVAMVKYAISGGFHIEYCDFLLNSGIGLLGWTINTGVIGLLTEYLGIRDFNFNLNELLFGLDKMKMDGELAIHDYKPKLYCAMESDEEMDTGEKLDKGKGIDREAHPNYDSNRGVDTGSLGSEIPPSDNGKGKAKEVASTSEPPFVTWSRVFPGLDPATVFFPKKFNPGPGFNVPGGEVPIRDDICKHIDYNSHILNQFKKMDLETAVQQKNNYLNFVNILNNKIAYAQGVLSKVPAIPTTEYEFRLKNQILRDLEGLNRDKVRSEAKATLLTSRIQFIELQMNINNSNNKNN